MAKVGETLGVKETISAIKERTQREGWRASCLVYDEVSKRLSSGRITKAEAKEVYRYFDENMLHAIDTREQIDNRRTWFSDPDNDYLAKDSSEARNKKLQKILKGTDLSMKDIYDAAMLAGDDCQVQRAKLSKAEKEAGKRGETTRSELHNIQNFLNAKIREHGGTKELSEKETIRIMENIPRVSDDTRTDLNLLKAALIAFSGGILWGPIAQAITGDDYLLNDMATDPKNEKAYGEQNGTTDGSVMNKLEAKMRRFDTEF